MTRAQRIKQVHARARIRRWEFRQRRLARGAWDRFRTALAMADTILAIDPETFHVLVGEGGRTDPRGEMLEPARRIVWITSERAARLGAARRLAPRLDAALLEVSCFALVPFAGIDPFAA